MAAAAFSGVLPKPIADGERSAPRAGGEEGAAGRAWPLRWRAGAWVLALCIGWGQAAGVPAAESRAPALGTCDHGFTAATESCFLTGALAWPAGTGGKRSSVSSRIHDGLCDGSTATAWAARWSGSGPRSSDTKATLADARLSDGGTPEAERALPSAQSWLSRQQPRKVSRSLS